VQSVWEYADLRTLSDCRHLEVIFRNIAVSSSPCLSIVLFFHAMRLYLSRPWHKMCLSLAMTCISAIIVLLNVLLPLISYTSVGSDSDNILARRLQSTILRSKVACFLPSSEFK
jgi:hypothetical protein